MSRLDDELRFALRREEPSPDFTARVLQQIAQNRCREVEKLTFWQRLRASLALPKPGWVAVGATAAVLLIVGLLLYPRLQSNAVNEQPELAEIPQNEQPMPAPTTTPAPQNTASEKALATGNNRSVPSLKPKNSVRRVYYRSHSAIAKKAPALKSEGEIAKDSLMLALQIASAKLNEAQRIVRSE